MHQPCRIVLTGGPGAGKTLVSSRLALELAGRLVVVPEAATQVYDALGTRWDRLDAEGRRDVQRRIFHLQIEQEDRLASLHPTKTLLLDRGTPDGAAYWPDGADGYWRDLKTTLPAQLARYDAVIWMESCAALGSAYYDGASSNACRFEDAARAVQTGRRLLEVWRAHPRLHHVGAFANLEDKISAVRKFLHVLDAICASAPLR